MLRGGWRAVAAAWLAIVAVGTLTFDYFLFPIPTDDGPIIILMSLVMAALFVGIPALLGILVVQAPTAAWAREKGWRLFGVAAITALANTAFTIALFTMFTSGNVLKHPAVTASLVGLGAVAALIWLFFDHFFAGKRSDA